MCYTHAILIKAELLNVFSSPKAETGIKWVPRVLTFGNQRAGSGHSIWGSSNDTDTLSIPSLADSLVAADATKNPTFTGQPGLPPQSGQLFKTYSSKIISPITKSSLLK